MASAPTPDAGAAPDPGGAAPGGAPEGQGAPPSQAPASPTQMALAKIYMLLKQMAQQDPTIAAEMAEAGQVIQKAQTKLVTQPQQQPTGASPSY